MSTSAVAKVCVMCGQDVAGKPRTKDRAGRYYCNPCWETATARSSRQLGNGSGQRREGLTYGVVEEHPIHVPALYECRQCRGQFAEHHVYSDTDGGIICKECFSQRTAAVTSDVAVANRSASGVSTSGGSGVGWLIAYCYCAVQAVIGFIVFVFSLDGENPGVGILGLVLLVPFAIAAVFLYRQYRAVKKPAQTAGTIETRSPTVPHANAGHAPDDQHGTKIVVVAGFCACIVVGLISLIAAFGGLSDGLKREQLDIAAVLMPLAVAGLCLWGTVRLATWWRESCPACNRWKAAVAIDATLVDRHNEMVTQRRQVTHRNSSGTPVGTSEWDEQVQVTVNTYLVDMSCKYCHHQWQTVSRTTS